MLAGLSHIWRAVVHQHVPAAAAAALAALLGIACRRASAQASERRRERRIREELEAYAYLNPRFGPGEDMSAFSRSVCHTISAKSLFRRAAILTRTPEGRFAILSSSGLDDDILAALNDWAAGLPESISASSPANPRSLLPTGIDIGARSRAIVPPGHHGRMIVIPFTTTGGRRLLGAIMVCADRMLSVRRGLVNDAIAPLESLALKLGRAIENSALAGRLLRAEKLAGLGLLASGVAHALNNPLTAVLGYAELIAETAAQPRIQENAETIRHEAERMRDTVQSLIELWRPSVHRDEIFHLSGLIHELAADCREKLAARNVQLVIESENDAPTIRGHRDRIRHVMEHLLNNAAQAIATRPSTAHTIRVALTHDTHAAQLIVSDTGPGFREPSRVFDPFYTTREPGEGAGLGLSLCYGIVREHNGNITAFNLYPHGAAVMIELPLSSEPAAPDFIAEAA